MAVQACPLCARSEAWKTELDRVHDLRYGVNGEYRYCRCGSCGLVVLHPMPDDLRAGYPAAYSQHRSAVAMGPGRTPLRRMLRHQVLAGLGYDHGRPPSRASRALLHVSPVRSLAQGGFLLVPAARPGGRLLDFGCGNGRFLATMASLGWETYGVESDPESAARARAASEDVTVFADLDSAGFPAGHFDVITLNHVIEHLEQPVELLRRLRDLLAPGGRLGVACPNWAAVSRRIWGRAWYALEAPRHTIHFEPDSLRATLERAGLVVESITTPSVREGPECWRKSWLYRYRRPAPRPIVAAGTAVSCTAALFGAGDEIVAWARPAERPEGT